MDDLFKIISKQCANGIRPEDLGLVFGGMQKNIIAWFLSYAGIIVRIKRHLVIGMIFVAAIILSIGLHLLITMVSSY